MSNTPEVILRLQPLSTLTDHHLPPHAFSRRTRHRVDTAALHMPASLHLGHAAVEGTLLDLSTGGCCVALSLPLPSALRPGITVTVMLPADHEHGYACPGEIRSIETGTASGRLHVYFATLAPEARRALLRWIGALAMQVYQ